jgi:acyl-coenzyme A synthetase/AMP-(fatty) acid ligase
VRFAAGLPHLCITSSLLDAATDRRAIDIDDATPAAVLFTSGSTGTPSAHHKTWGMLTQGARVLGDGLGLADQPGTLLSSVPQQHMFGLESTILLPLQSGFTLAAGCPLLPSDVHAAIAQHAAPLWWMTTPMHLRACVDSGLSFSPLAGILSSTQTLAPELARAAEACFQTRVHEVYGCTEAGLIGLRRTAHEAAWHLCADLDMASDAEHTLVSGERSGAALKLHDHIERLPGRRFVLHGRYADLIKVGGKRMNLHALNQLLRSLPGVDDAVFFQPDAGARLHAFVVAPTLDRPRILAALRGRIDPAFLPRPLHLLDALPRNAMGKLSHQALLELAQQLA